MDPFIFPAIKNLLPAASVQDNLTVFQTVFIPVIAVLSMAGSFLCGIDRHGCAPSFLNEGLLFYPEYITGGHPLQEFGTHE